MLTIANPIYDSVFKFLMEDERVARTILSALLKKDILQVEVRPHEYSNAQRDTLSMFRIDFAATIREDDGHEHLILIEVQKTWLETETLRFRQYLGVQYQRKENIMADSPEGYAMPMVAVYILGHKVGDIEHDAYDYNDRRVTRGIPNAFVDSLTHDSIVVQIPRLHGQINNRLDKVLSVFDQTLHLPDSEHFLSYDDSRYLGDEDMQPILHRLLMAASDADTRQDMNVEDEYYSIIEKRDTELMLSARRLAEQNAQITEQKAQLTEQKAQLTEQKAQLTEQKAQLTEQKAVIETNEKIIRTSVRLLHQSGLSAADIASQLNLSTQAVEAYITQNL